MPEWFFWSKHRGPSLSGILWFPAPSWWIWKWASNTSPLEFALRAAGTGGATGKVRRPEGVQNGQWTNMCQPSWTWHVRNASYVFPPTNSFLVHPPFPSPTSAHIKVFFFKYTLLNKQADIKTRARISSLQFSAWRIHGGEVVFWSVFAFCSGWFTRNWII